MNERSLLAPIASMVVLLGGCGLPGFVITPRVASLSVDGELGASIGGSSGSSDLETMGLDDSEEELGGRVDFNWGGMQLAVDYLSFSGSGEGTIEQNFELGGGTITAGDTVETDLDIGVGSAFLSWDFLPTDMFEAGIGLGVAVLDLEGTVTSQTTAETASGDETLPLPVVGGRAAFAMGPFKVGALLQGMAIKIDDVDTTYMDFDLNGRWRLFGLTDEMGAFALVAGYRYIVIDAEFEDGNSDVDLDSDLTGPYVGVSLLL